MITVRILIASTIAHWKAQVSEVVWPVDFNRQSERESFKSVSTICNRKKMLKTFYT